MWVKTHRIIAGATARANACVCGVFDPPRQARKSPTSRSAGSVNTCFGSRFNLIQFSADSALRLNFYS